MPEDTPRFREVFFEACEAVPRQGPGNRASVARALGLCGGVPPFAPGTFELVHCMEERIRILRHEHDGDAEATAVLDLVGRESRCTGATPTTTPTSSSRRD